jgi:hypothetical protein
MTSTRTTKTLSGHLTTYTYPLLLSLLSTGSLRITNTSFLLVVKIPSLHTPVLCFAHAGYIKIGKSFYPPFVLTGQSTPAKAPSLFSTASAN